MRTEPFFSYLPLRSLGAIILGNILFNLYSSARSGGLAPAQSSPALGLAHRLTRKILLIVESVSL